MNEMNDGFAAKTNYIAKVDLIQFLTIFRLFMSNQLIIRAPTYKTFSIHL